MTTKSRYAVEGAQKLRREPEWLLELLNSSPEYEVFADQLRELEVRGKEIAQVYAKPKVKKLIAELDSADQDLILPRTRAKNAYEHFRRLEGAVQIKVQPYATAPRFFFDIRTQRWGSVESGQEDFPKEFLALEYLKRLLLEGKLNRLRRCARCHEWFLARLRGQLCCGPRCRLLAMRAKKGFKKDRRIYMQKYRALLKQHSFKSTHPETRKRRRTTVPIKEHSEAELQRTQHKLQESKKKLERLDRALTARGIHRSG